MDITAITRGVSRAGLLLTKYSPAIMTGVGIVGTGVATVLACKQTLKAEPILDKFHKGIDDSDAAYELVNHPDYIGDDTYTDADKRSDIILSYRDATISFLKLYAVPLAIGAISVGLLISGQKVMWTRNAGLAVAFETMKTSFDRYRANVVKDLDETHDINYLAGTRRTEETVTDEKVSNPPPRSLRSPSIPMMHHCMPVGSMRRIPTTRTRRTPTSSFSSECSPCSTTSCAPTVTSSLMRCTMLWASSALRQVVSLDGSGTVTETVTLISASGNLIRLTRTL